MDKLLHTWLTVGYWALGSAHTSNGAGVGSRLHDDGFWWKTKYGLILKTKQCDSITPKPDLCWNRDLHSSSFYCAAVVSRVIWGWRPPLMKLGQRVQNINHKVIDLDTKNTQECNIHIYTYAWSFQVKIEIVQMYVLCPLSRFMTHVVKHVMHISCPQHSEEREHARLVRH